MSEGSLQKLVVKAFKDPKLKDEANPKEYTTLVNPEKFALAYKSEYQKPKTQGNSNTTLKYTTSIPSELDIDFLFDRTGVFGTGQSKDEAERNVEQDINLFKSVILNYDGENHKPNYLRVLWGELNFPCVMISMNLEYKLFSPNGKPLRAVAKVKFQNFIEEEKRVAEEKKSSPDLTHGRIVKEGDTLPLMTHRIYGDSKYYLEVAMANGITNFRKMKPGTKIYFPPIEKVTK